MTAFADIFAAHADVIEQSLGESVTYTHYSEAGTVAATFPKAVSLVHFRESMRDRRSYDDGQGDTYEAEVGVRVSDLGRVPTVNEDSFTRDGVTWICRAVRGTEGSVALCTFGSFKNKERSARDYRRAR